MCWETKFWISAVVFKHVIFMLSCCLQTRSHFQSVFKGGSSSMKSKQTLGRAECSRMLACLAHLGSVFNISNVTGKKIWSENLERLLYWPFKAIIPTFVAANVNDTFYVKNCGTSVISPREASEFLIVHASIWFTPGCFWSIECNVQLFVNY